MYEIYTDGAYSSSKDAGGTSAIILKDNKIIQKLYQGYHHTTNNRCEIMATIMALEYFKNPETIKIYSDSSYVVNTINNGWAKKWFEEQDFSKKNLDLWFKLIDLIDFHDVEFVWVKGHADNENNCIADMLAQHAANCLNLKTDICISD